MSYTNVFSYESQDIGFGAAVPVVVRRMPDGGAEALPLTTSHISPFDGFEPSIRFRNESVSSESLGGFISVTKVSTQIESVDAFLIDPWETDPYVTIEREVEVTVTSLVARESLDAWASPNFIPRTEGSVEIWAGAGLVSAKRPPRQRLGNVGAARRGGGLRGAISGFSVSSRRRLIRTVAKVRNKVMPSFLTLTYPGHEGKDYLWMSDAKEWKRHLDVFVKRLRRRFKIAGGIWKLEPQRRGAPHFHIMVWGCNHFELDAWVRRAWFEVVGSGDEKHLVHGADCGFVRSWRGVTSYASKYLGKVIHPADGFEADLWDFPGRWWGVFGAADLPWGEKITVALRRAEANILIRTMRRYAKIKGRDFSSLTILCNDATWWFEHLNQLVCWGGA